MEDTQLVNYQTEDRDSLERKILSSALKISLANGDLVGVNLCHKQLFLTLMDGNSLNTLSLDSSKQNTSKENDHIDITKSTLSLPSLVKNFQDNTVTLPSFIEAFADKIALFNKDKAYQNLYKLLSVTSFASFADLKQNYWVLAKNIIHYKSGFKNERVWNNSLIILNIAHDILRIPKLRAQHDLIAQNLPITDNLPVVKTSLTKIPRIKRKIKFDLTDLLVKADLIKQSDIDKILTKDADMGNQALGIILVQENFLNAHDLNVVLKCLKLINNRVIKFNDAIQAIKEYQLNKTDVHDFLLKNNLVRQDDLSTYFKSFETSSLVSDNNEVHSINQSDTDLNAKTLFDQGEENSDDELIIDFSFADETTPDSLEIDVTIASEASKINKDNINLDNITDNTSIQSLDTSAIALSIETPISTIAEQSPSIDQNKADIKGENKTLSQEDLDNYIDNLKINNKKKKKKRH